MKFPNHIILDVSSSLSYESYKHWSIRNLISEKNKFTHGKIVNYLSKKSKVYKYEKLLNQNHPYSSPTNNFFFKSENSGFSFNLKIKNKSLKNKKVFNIKNLKFIISNSYLSHTSTTKLKKSSFSDLFDIHFLRKEKIYTKLKYSRVPQYDIVSGGVAALFAGFLGFLICEKFGFELLDSGDFYTFFMYAVFFSFFCKLFLKLFSVENQWSVFGISWFYSFYKLIITLIFNKLLK